MNENDMKTKRSVKAQIIGQILSALTLTLLTGGLLMVIHTPAANVFAIISGLTWMMLTGNLWTS